MEYLKKLAHGLCTAVFTGILIVGIVLLVMRGLGFRLYAVKTASMEDVYPVGTLLAVKNVVPEELQEGDVITFLTESDAVVTHRVIENNREEELLYTKGDGNEAQDASPVAYENVLGKATFGIPYLGYAVFVTRESSFRKVLIAMLALAAGYLAVCAILYVARKVKTGRK